MKSVSYQEAICLRFLTSRASKGLILLPLFHDPKRPKTCPLFWWAKSEVTAVAVMLYYPFR
jgi:hypothetical protein